MYMEFRFVDLFAGIGGFHMALASRGGKCVFASEIEENAARIYETTWMRDGTNISGDILNYISENSTSVPEHDVLTAGFPCQPFSKSGNQRGINEARGTLFWSIAKVLEHRKPKLIILENVRNLIGPKHREDYLRMISILRDLGYAVSTEPTILSPHRIPIKQGGTPQHRERVFITGVYVGKTKAKQLTDIDPLVRPEELKEFKVPNWKLDRYLVDLKQSQVPGYAKLSELEEEAIDIWSEFVDLMKTRREKKIPSFPIWTEYFRERKSIRIASDTPDWKRKFIEQNSSFYEENKKTLANWLKKLEQSQLTPSMRKFEWQAGEANGLNETLLQFRPSGLRAKRRNYVPAFVAINQTTILAKERRKLLVEEAAKLQGFGTRIKFGQQEPPMSYKQIGNAVHPGVVDFVMERLLRQSVELTGSQISYSEAKG